jgi:hypothetical protein
LRGFTLKTTYIMRGFGFDFGFLRSRSVVSLFCIGGAEPVKGGTSLFRPLTGLAPVQGCSYDRPSAEENQNNWFPLVRSREI